jgi:hypothetical protein
MTNQVIRIEEVSNKINSYQSGNFKKTVSKGISYQTIFGVWCFFKSSDGFVGYLKNQSGEIAQFGEYTRKDWSGGRVINKEEIEVLKLIAMDAVNLNVTKWN